MHPHGVDYRRTSSRLGWEQIPAEAVEALGAALGSAVVAASAPVEAGFGGQYAGTVRLADGSHAFAKAAPQELEFPVASLRREAEVLAQLPATVPCAALRACVDTAGWVLLAVDHLEGRMPGQPWTVADLGAAYDACCATASSAFSPGLGAAEYADAVRRDDRLVTTEEDLAAGTFDLPTRYGEDAWLARAARTHGSEIAALSASAAEMLRGDALCHNDLRPDNMILTDGCAIIVDWNFVTTAPRWLDFVGLLPMAARQRVDLTAWWQRPLLADATDEQIDSFLAATGVYMLSTQCLPPPPGCTTAARRHQLVYAGDFVRLLAQRRGWRWAGFGA